MDPARRHFLQLLANCDQQITEAEALIRNAVEPHVRQQTKLRLESLKLDREVIERRLREE